MVTKPTRIVSIDYGLARIGMAVSDERKVIAMALPTVTCERKLEQTIEKIAKALSDASNKGGYDIQEIVIGLPLRMDGKVGLMADEVHLFVEGLKQLVSAPIVLWDERLTSVQADRSMREGKMNRKSRSKVVDQVAAIIILQTYLDSLSLPS